jgi:hypothetical protein
LEVSEKVLCGLFGTRTKLNWWIVVLSIWLVSGKQQKRQETLSFQNGCLY